MFHLQFAVLTFYINEYIHLILSKEKGDSLFLPSHEAFKKEFYAMRQKFNFNLAHALYDYIVFISILEMREAYNYCDIAPTRLLGRRISDCYYDKYIIWDNFHRISIPEWYELCEIMFLKGYWDDLFGGKKYWDAIYYCINLFPKNYICFIDSVIDLQHNTNTLFSKSNPIFLPLNHSLHSYLNKKTSLVDEELNLIHLFHSYGKNYYRSSYLDNLYKRFARLYKKDYEDTLCGYIKNEDWDIGHKRWNRDAVLAFWNYKPVQYTGEFNSYKIVFSDDLHEN